LSPSSTDGPIRHWWTRSWSWNSFLRFVSSSCQLKFHLILKDLSLLSHFGLIWAVMLLSSPLTFFVIVYISATALLVMYEGCHNLLSFLFKS
jgi:hypothetical protein